MESLIRRLSVGDDFKRHLVIVYYLLQLLFILLYASPEVQPFVYVRF